MTDSSVLDRPRPRRSRRAAPEDRPPVDGWWGNGAPPWERWPGVTIRLEGAWSTARRRWESPDGRYFYDPDAADRAVDFFPTFLRHHIGEWAGRPFRLLPYQEMLLTRPIFGWKRVEDGLRRFRRVFAFVPKGAGKALALDTRIPTPAGWTTMGDIGVGDALFDERGEICHVIGVSDVMVGRPCYRVEFSDGASIVADAEHLWQTTMQRSGRPRRGKHAPGPRLGEPGLVTTAEIARTLRVKPSSSRHPQAKWNHRIEVAAPLRTEGVVLPVPPYTLGAWLGDGDSDGARLTMAHADAGIAEAIMAEGVEMSTQREHSPTVGRRGLAGMHANLRALGVLGNKHIPALYLRASIEQRLALLQGLMDTDGYIDVKGRAEFTTTSPALSAGMLELLRTMGYKARVREGRATLRGRDVGPKYRIQFMPCMDRPPFRLARKAARMVRAPRGRRLSASRRIVGCTPVPSVPVRCIRVDSPSRLFLAGDAMIPTHNSPWGSGTGMYLALCDDEPAAEVYAVAGDKPQARIVHDNAKIMVETSPELSEMLEVLKDSIHDPASRSTYTVLSAEASTKHGFRPHGVIFDEFHNQPDRDLFEALKKSMVKRRQPLLLIITHSGDDQDGICYEEYEYAKKVLSGTVPDESCLPVIFEASPDDDWTDPAVWARVNPGHGITVKHPAIAAECEEAKAEPRKLNDFLRFHLNRWVNAATAWIPVDDWDRCEVPIDLDALRGLPVHAGLDMAQKIDMAALTLVFPAPLAGEEASQVTVTGTDELGEAVTRTVSLNFSLTLLPVYWIPEATMHEHEKREGIPFSQWAADGLVRVTEGNVIDYDAIVRDITGPVLDEFPLLKQGQIGYDPAFATDIALQLGQRGLTCVEILQNYKHLSEPCHIFEALVKGRRIRHDGHRVLRWNVENAAIKRDDAGRIRPVKPRRASKRIDGLVAALMGLSRAVLQPIQPAAQWRILPV